MFLQMGFRKPFYIYSLLLFFISINQQFVPLLVTLQAARWSFPRTIPLYQPETWPPILVADQDQTVHAFSSQWIIDESGKGLRVIFYNRWTFQQGWTVPIDIIISPIKEARITDAYLDKEGILHVIFWGGDNTQADIYYSKASAAVADDAHAWSAPIIIGKNAGDPEEAAFFEDDQGILYTIYSGRELGYGLYIVKSADKGDTWSDPTSIFFSQSNEPAIAQLHVVKGQSGWLHAIWGVYSVGGQGRGIYYARSNNGSEWSEPVLLDDALEGLGTQTPAIIEHNGTLIALYNMTPKITMRRSFDNGETWSSESVIFPRHVGVNGSLSLVIDRNNELHLFFGQRITGSPDIHGMWHSQLVKNRWTDPEAVIKGPQINDPIGDKSFDPNSARAVVSGDNVLLVTWRTDPGFKGNGVWYSYQKLNLALLSKTKVPINISSGLHLLPTATPIMSTTTADQIHLTPKSTALPELSRVRPKFVLTTSDILMLNGLFSAVVVMVILFVIRRNHRNH